MGKCGEGRAGWNLLDFRKEISQSLGEQDERFRKELVLSGLKSGSHFISKNERITENKNTFQVLNKVLSGLSKQEKKQYCMKSQHQL